MKSYAPLFLMLLLLVFLVPAAGAKSKEKEKNPEAGTLEIQAKKDLADLDVRVARFARNVADLNETFAREISERDKLMLQKRFVAGKEFYFMLEDYRDAAEIFWGIIEHPAARQFPKYNDAIYYLAESLFQLGYYYDSQKQFERLLPAGSTGPYFTLSLMRLIEISIAQKNYSAAEKYYSRLLSDAPAGTDSSLGTYLIGKSHFLRGDAAGAFQVLDSIPETAGHYAIANYYMAAYQVKNGQYQDALDRLRKMRGALDNENIAHAEEIVPLAHLSLGRLLYETNDFPQALSQYLSVPRESPHYAEALYESMWVLSTRNDFLLKAVSEEDGNFSLLANEYAYLNESLAREQDAEGVTPLVDSTDQLEPDLSEMNSMLAKIDERLATLQEEAVKTYSGLVALAPGSPDLPDADILLGGIYTQVREFDKAEQWYKTAQGKYSGFASRVRDARTRFQNDQIALQAVEAGNTPQGKPMPDTSGLGIPPEITYWLAADAQVKEVFANYKQLQDQRRNLQIMGELATKIEAELRNLETGAGFPVLKESKRKVQDLQAEASSLQGLVMAVASELVNVAEEQERQALQARIPEFEQAVAKGKASLKTIDQQIDRKKREKIATFREDYRNFTAPIAGYADQVERLYAEASNQTAQAARNGLAQIENKLYDTILKAQIGVVDTAWRATEGSSDDVKKLQRQMEEEIRTFRRQLRGTSTPPAESGQ